LVLEKVAIAGLNKAITELTNTMKQTWSFSDNAQKASLALGSNLRQTKDRLGPSIDALRGSLDKRFMAGMLTLEAGLQGNSAGVAKLINQQQLTGGQYQGTAKAFAKLIKIGGVQADAANALAEDLISTGNEFGVSTDVLVDAISSLESNMAAMNLAEMGPQVTEAMAQLQTQLGPELAGPLKSVMGMVMDTSIEGYANLTKLGIEGVREQLAAATTTAEATQILKDAFVTASDSFNTIAGGAKDGFFQIGIATGIFSEAAINFGPLSEALTTGLRERNQADVAYADSLSTLRSEVLDPLRETLMSIFVAVLPTVIAVFKKASQIVQIAVDKIKEFYVSIGGISTTIDFVKENFEILKKNIILVGTILLIALKPAIIAIVTGLWSFVMAVGAIVLPITILIASIVFLYNKVDFVREGLDAFGRFIKNVIIGSLKLLRDALAKMVSGIGILIEGIAKWADILPGSDAMEDLGRGIQSMADMIGGMGEGGDGDGLSGADLDNAFQDQLDADMRTLGIAQDSKDHLASIDAKTPDPTSSAFMDSTVVDLSRSIESILGGTLVGGDRDLFEDMVVTLGDIAESTGATADNAGAGGAGFSPP
jgi:hypothetical protein